MPFPILGSPKPAFFDSSGSPLVSGTLSILEPADDTNKASYPTYDDAVALTNANTNPIVIDSRGEIGLWGLDGEDYKLVLKDANGDTIWTVDDIQVPIALPYGITSAETTAGVTPTNYQYPPGNVLRYGDIDLTGIVNATTILDASNGLARYIPDGTVLVDDSHPVDVYYGEGFIKKSYGTFPANRGENEISITTLSEATLSQINPRGWDTDGRYAYVCCQGTYDASQQGYLDIVDVQNPYDLSKVGSLAVGASGVVPRSLVLFGKYAYISSTGGLLYIVDVSDKANPTLATTRTLNTGNREYMRVIGDVLVIPKQTGNIDFYSLRNPLNPLLISTLTVSGIFYEPILDGSLLWILNADAAGVDALLCVDISDPYNPSQVSLTTLATVIESRRGVIRGRYLYTGGFGASSRLNIIDISDASTPAVVYTHATETASYVQIMGNYLLANSNVYDITDPIVPVLVYTHADTPSYAKAFGANIVGYGPGTGAQGPSANDGNADPTLRASRFSNNYMPGVSAGNVLAKEAIFDDLTVRSVGRFGTGIIAGPGGFATPGPISASRVNIRGALSTDVRESTAIKYVTGDISTLTNIFDVHGQTHVSFTLKYTLIADQSAAGSAAHTAGIKSFSGYVSPSTGAYTARLAVADFVTERTVGAASTLTVTITNAASASDPIKIGVTCAELSTSNARAIFELQVFGTDGNHEINVI